MAAYAIDLRQNILRACERHLGSQRTIVHLFGVRLAFVENVLRQYRITGDIAPQSRAGGQKPRLDAAAQGVVRRLVGDHSEATLEALCTSVAAATGVRVRVPTRCRVLQRLRVPRQKSRSRRRNARPRASNRRGRAIRNDSRPSLSGA
jgi:transposase